ncbi:pseudouridine synthase [Thermaurantimonas aggregans]|uniref:pseudouridine synthase n=1 Tax=Thermaurantimonas aggregans TaxID=2173829 RepID=UPI0023F3D249|nr:pseudouridine synthase [Thermaurantimonas aggregans]MCX8149332.1 pseudouridine synthase [Thermaurantimonas aggregans]
MNTWDKNKGERSGKPLAREGKPNNRDNNKKSHSPSNFQTKNSYQDKKQDFRKKEFTSDFKSREKNFEQKSNFKGGFKRYYKKPQEPQQTIAEPKDNLVRLNKFLANAGICSRREADELIRQGLVEVNGKIVTEMGIRIDPEKDVVKYGGSTIKGEKKVYILLNKPKGYITTTKDEKARKNVMELVAGACKERIYPVGRLDRQTTGLLLLTNDGELAKKLTHPSHGAPKLYHVVLDKNVSPGDLEKIRRGVVLDDGPAPVDEIEYVEGKDRNQVGIKLHIGRNRIVRRIFEHLGYQVVALDRTMFAGLTKKNLPRGHYRFLTEKEIAYLKML